MSSTYRRAWGLLLNEWHHLTTVQPSQRPWQLPFVAGLASGVPLAIGAWFNRMDYGVLSSLGALVFLYTSNMPLAQRMAALMVCGFGMAACFALALMGVALHPMATVFVLAVLTLLVGMVVRYYQLQPPGSMFFIMAASIAAYLPSSTELIPLRVGLVFLGSVVAVMFFFLYSIYMLPRLPPPTPVPAPTFDFQYVVYDSVLIALFAGLSLALAEAMGLRSSYWVAVSCIVIMQNVTMRAVWNKQVQRILGTAIGLGLAWLVLKLPLGNWAIALLIAVLTFVIESLVVRHYASAIVFITPLTILQAEAATGMRLLPEVVIHARMLDIVLGSVIGMVGGIFLHQLTLRAWISRHVFRRPLPPTRVHGSG